eukprot:CAMPEP_0204290014 /NCGR_PEP_ID=MMETSP0468-20130131/59699_1 /ASSEMBLY_ACC=CAM_ASM_000383 /TAXON_ID=2969 /ORGANISM="Oxyrrhis marina" /LENGTH=46 /DNA_ID= /DNA_START= /DNA_END= /DNA_ORIENTATION=
MRADQRASTVDTMPELPHAVVDPTVVVARFQGQLRTPTAVHQPGVV